MEQIRSKLFFFFSPPVESSSARKLSEAFVRDGKGRVPSLRTEKALCQPSANTFRFPQLLHHGVVSKVLSVSARFTLLFQQGLLLPIPPFPPSSSPVPRRAGSLTVLYGHLLLAKIAH